MLATQIMSVTRIPGFSTDAPKRNLLVVIVYLVVILLLFSILTGFYDVVPAIVAPLSLGSRAERRCQISSKNNSPLHRTIATIWWREP